MDWTIALSLVDAGWLAVALAVVMLVGWGVGWLIGLGHRKAGKEKPDFKFDDVSIALLGLLLAFTFAMSLSKHDQRRAMGISDSNAIGDFYTCSSLLKEPVRTELRTVIREYAVFRYELPNKRVGEAGFEEALKKMEVMQGRMTELVSKALDAGTPIAVPLTNTLNDVTSMHAARLAAIADRLPVTIILLLGVAAMTCMTLIGRQEGALGKPQVAATLTFILLVSLVFFVTLDLNQPYRGLINVSQLALERLIGTMGP